jgi:hypothetical protein
MAKKSKAHKTGALPKVAASSVEESVPVAAGDLFLDPKNPRLIDSKFGIGDQDKILARLWEEFYVREIADSIVASDSFWQHEPLIAAREDGKLVVIEGNRRLAAVQLLLSPERRKAIGASGIPEISEALKKKTHSFLLLKSQGMKFGISSDLSMSTDRKSGIQLRRLNTSFEFTKATKFLCNKSLMRLGIAMIPWNVFTTD